MDSEASSPSQPVRGNPGNIPGSKGDYQVEGPRATKPQGEDYLIGCLSVALSESALDCTGPENPAPPG